MSHLILIIFRKCLGIFQTRSHSSRRFINYEHHENINKAKVGLKRSGFYQKPDRQQTLVQNESVSITLFAFDKGEEISTHESGGDAFVTCLDGTGEITIDGVKYELHEGESIVMPANIRMQV